MYQIIILIKIKTHPHYILNVFAVILHERHKEKISGENLENGRQNINKTTDLMKISCSKWRLNTKLQPIAQLSLGYI